MSLQIIVTFRNAQWHGKACKIIILLGYVLILILYGFDQVVYCNANVLLVLTCEIHKTRLKEGHHWWQGSCWVREVRAMEENTPQSQEQICLVGRTLSASINDLCMVCWYIYRGGEVGERWREGRKESALDLTNIISALWDYFGKFEFVMK